MAPNEQDTQQISEEVLKESKIIQEEIKSLLSGVCLLCGNSCNCKLYFLPCPLCPPAGAEVKRLWSCTSTPPYTFMA
jgi:hypothetical protein